MSLAKSEAVLIFDGDCGFCTTVANYLTKRTKFPVKAEAWQLTDLNQYGLSPEQTAAKVYFVTTKGVVAGARAMALLLSAQNNFFYYLMGKLISVPPFSWLAIPAYALIAKYRHKLPGGTPACKL